MALANRPDRNAHVAALAHQAHQAGHKANQAIMTAYGVSVKTAIKMLTLARKAGHDIPFDERRPTRPAVYTLEQRRNMSIGQQEAFWPVYDPAPWREHANCKNVNVNLFFPEQGDNSTVWAAKQVCRACTVRTECLQYALNMGDKFGIWGGTSERQRRLIRAGYLTVEDCA